MKATAHFHPKFGEEVTCLPPKTQHQIYLDLFEQDRIGPLAYNYQSAKFKKPFERINFQTFYIARDNAIACFDTKLTKNAFTYLHIHDVITERDEENFHRVNKSRFEEMRNNRFEPFTLDDMLSQGDEEIVQQALDEFVSNNNKLIAIHMIKKSKEKIDKQMRELFNLTDRQLTRFETRMDFYLKILNAELTSNQLSITLNINGTDNFNQSFKQISDLNKLKKID